MTTPARPHENKHVPGVLLIDDEESFAEEVKARLDRACRFHWAANLEQANAILGNEIIDVVFLDLDLGADHGFRFLEAQRRMGSDLPVIVMSRDRRRDSIAQAVRLGAVGYIPKDFTDEDFQISIYLAEELARERSRMRLEWARRQEDAFDFIAEAPASRHLLEEIEVVAPRRAPVLLVGETGTGKTRIAREIHERSGRKGHFVVASAQDLHSAIGEDVLFGHVRGAFTGASARRIGVIEYANGGTLLLDDITSIPLECQSRLLRFLDDGMFRRLGSDEAQHSDVRVIAACFPTLRERIRSGEFREDLYYRLQAFTIAVPPLRERREDIPALTRVLAGDIVVRESFPPPQVSESLLQHLQTRRWSGNIRELRDAIWTGIVRARGGEIRIEHLPAEHPEGYRKEAADDALTAMPYAVAKQRAHLDFMHRYVLHHLERSRGNIVRAAEAAGMNRNTLSAQIQELRAAGYEVPEF